MKKTTTLLAIALMALSCQQEPPSPKEQLLQPPKTEETLAAKENALRLAKEIEGDYVSFEHYLGTKYSSPDGCGSPRGYGPFDSLVTVKAIDWSRVPGQENPNARSTSDSLDAQAFVEVTYAKCGLGKTTVFGYVTQYDDNTIRVTLPDSSGNAYIKDGVLGLTTREHFQMWMGPSYYVFDIKNAVKQEEEEWPESN